MGDAFLIQNIKVKEIFNPIIATGGTVTDLTINGIEYRYHAFTSVGTSTFNITDTGTNSLLEYLIVAGGGGGGGNSRNGGGGGAGGLRTNVFNEPLEINQQSYSVVVGNGGITIIGVAAGTPGVSGQNSSAFGVTSIGGGFGGSWNSQYPVSGGSGGGGGSQSSELINGASGTTGQGNSGGQNSINTSGSTNDRAGGSGGGAGEAGLKGVNGLWVRGGNGLNLSAYFPNWGTNSSNTTTGTRGWFAGGGAAGSRSVGYTPSGTAPGGTGGGGFWAFNTTTNIGLANTGGGGGATGRDDASQKPGNGGSGIVIIRYPLVQVN